MPAMVRGVVFQDGNRNGIQDEGETGLVGAEVSNGRIFVQTGARGEFECPAAPKGQAIFVVRSGLQECTTPAYVAADGSVNIHFGLAVGPPAGDAWLLAHLSNVEVANADAASTAAGIVKEIGNMLPAPIAIVATGACGAAVSLFINNSPVRILASDPAVPRYVTEAGAFRIVFLPSSEPEDAAFLKAAMASAPLFRPMVIVLPAAPSEAFRAALDSIPQRTIVLYHHNSTTAEGPRTIFAGSRPASRPAAETVDPNWSILTTASCLSGGDDGSPRAFRMLRAVARDEQKPATITTEVRPLFARRRAAFLWPQAGTAVSRGPLDVRVNCYDTFFDPVLVQVTLRDSRGAAVGAPMKRSGQMLWRAQLDTTKLSTGRTEAVVHIEDTSGATWETRHTFGIIELDPADAASRPASLEPPIAPLWSTYVGGDPIRQEIVAFNKKAAVVVTAHNGRRDVTIVDPISGRVEAPPESGLESLEVLITGAAHGAPDPKDPARQDRNQHNLIYKIVDDRIVAFDATDQSRVFSNPNPLGGSTVRPVVAGNLILATAADATLIALDAKTGTTAWIWNKAANALDASVPKAPLGRTIAGAPLVHGNYAYFGANDGRLYVIDVHSGVTRHWFRIGAPIAAPPFLVHSETGETLLLILARDGHIHAFAKSRAVR